MLDLVAWERAQERPIGGEQISERSHKPHDTDIEVAVNVDTNPKDSQTRRCSFLISRDLTRVILHPRSWRTI